MDEAQLLEEARNKYVFDPDFHAKVDRAVLAAMNVTVFRDEIEQEKARIVATKATALALLLEERGL